MWRKFLLCVLLFFYISCNANAFNEEEYELYVTSLQLSDLVLSESFVVYQHSVSGIYYLSILDFARNMNIKLSKDGDNISGWIMNEEDSFVINTKTKIVQRKDNNDLSLKEEDLISVYGDDYISFASLEAFMPLSVIFDNFQQVIKVETKVVLPIQQQISRDQKYQKLAKFKEQNTKNLYENLPLEVQEYGLFSIPNLRFNYDTNFSSKQPQQRTDALSFYVNNHTGYHLMNAAGTVSNGNISSMRLSMQKNDFIKRPFEHQLHAKQYWFGDIASKPINLISSSVNGIGFFVSNIPPGWKIDFNNLYITGYAVPHWSVEVYINNNLFNFATVNETGVYSFQDVPLNVGLNTVKLIFYGPYGEKKEVVENINLSSSLLPKNKLVYEITKIKEGSFLFENAQDESLINTVQKGDIQQANFRYGLGDKTAIAIGMVNRQKNLLNDNKNAENYIHSSFTTGLEKILLNMDIVNQVNTDGYAVNLSANTPVFTASNLFVSSQFFSNKFNNVIYNKDSEGARKLSNEMRLTTGKNIFGRYLSTIYYLNFAQLNSGSITHTNSLRNSMSVYSFLNISHTFTINKILNDIQAYGALNVTTRYKNILILRGSINYVPFFGQQGIASHSLNINYNIGKYGISFGTTGDAAIGVNFNRRYFTTSVSFGYSKMLGMQVKLGIASGVVFSGITPKITPANTANSGTVEVQAFLDENQNGIFDFDEEPLPGVGVKVSSKEDKEVTNEEGKMIITNLPVGSEIPFDINTGIVPDISMKAGNGVKKRLVLLSGATHKVQLPVIRTTEIDGTLSITNGEMEIPIANTVVKLVNRENEIVKTTTTSSDGYYIFTEVPHGLYKVKISTEDAKRYKDYLMEQ